MTAIKTNVPGYMKDSKSNLVSNHNESDLNLYKAQRQRLLMDKSINNRLDQIEEKLDFIINKLLKE